MTHLCHNILEIKYQEFLASSLTDSFEVNLLGGHGYSYKPSSTHLFFHSLDVYVGSTLATSSRPALTFPSFISTRVMWKLAMSCHCIYRHLNTVQQIVSITFIHTCACGLCLTTSPQELIPGGDCTHLYWKSPRYMVMGWNHRTFMLG